MPILQSIQIGLPKQYGDPTDPQAGGWTTGIFKSPIEGRVPVNERGVEGDGQADPKNHGGIDKAVLAYSADHYPYWRQELAIPDLPYGAFGENLSVFGQSEKDVCIGDRYQIGDVTLEVSQPRQPCWKLGRRWQEKLLPKWVVETGFCGWYFRVVQGGWIQNGQSVSLLSRPCPAWTIQRSNDLLYQKTVDPDALKELFLLSQLSWAWKQSLG